jgi:hypothetical protein
MFAFVILAVRMSNAPAGTQIIAYIIVLAVVAIYYLTKSRKSK